MQRRQVSIDMSPRRHCYIESYNTQLSPTALPNHCAAPIRGAGFSAITDRASDWTKNMKLEKLRGLASALRGPLGLRDPTFSLDCRNYIPRVLGRFLVMNVELFEAFN